MPSTNPSAIATMPTDRAMMAFRRQFFGGWDLEGDMDSPYITTRRLERKSHSLLINNKLPMIAIPRWIIVWGIGCALGPHGPRGFHIAFIGVVLF